jgi:hypothetical protein
MPTLFDGEIALPVHFEYDGGGQIFQKMFRIFGAGTIQEKSIINHR